MEYSELISHFFTLCMLVLLQAVLGFDNLLYISLESKRAPEAQQSMVRKSGILIAVALRIVLLFVLVKAVKTFTTPLFGIHLDYVEMTPNLHSIIELLGGLFILYTATKEIMHMVALEDHVAEEKKPRSVASIVTWIVMMNLVFSFDSILSAMALSDEFWVMATAIIIGGILMVWLADKVADFLQKNRMYEVLGLFILFVVGIMLITEGGHLAHVKLFGQEVHAMTKTTFYFVIGALVTIDIVQSRYRKKLEALQAEHHA